MLHRGEESVLNELGVEVRDNWTLRIELEQPSRYFLYLLNHDVTKRIPSHIVASHGDAWANLDKMVFNGPFRLESFERNHSLISRRNPTYHGDYRGNLETIDIRFMSGLSDDPEILMAEYEKDQIDILNLSWLSPAAKKRTLQRYGSEYITAAILATHNVVINVKQPPFDDPRIRQALVLATDRPGFAAISEMGFGSVATGGFTPIGVPGHFPDLALPYDVNGAQRLMAEEGFPGGAGFSRAKALLYKFSINFC